MQPDLAAAGPRDHARSVGSLAVELDPQHTRALEVVALARVESARAHERHTILGDLSRAGKQQRRHRASAEVREHHARDVVRGRGRERVEVAVRVEVDERELRLGSERTRQSARDERALSADDERQRALAQRDEDTVRKRPAGLARGAQPAIARIEWDAHALLSAKAFGEERSERRGGFLEAAELLLCDDAGLEEMERASRHLWSHGSPSGKQPTAAMRPSIY